MVSYGFPTFPKETPYDSLLLPRGQASILESHLTLLDQCAASVCQLFQASGCQSKRTPKYHPPKKNTKEFWIINSWLGAWAYVRGVCWTFPSNGFPKRYCIQIGMFSEKRSKTLKTFHSNDWFIARVLTMAYHTVVKSAIHSHYGHSSSEKRVGS